MDQTLIEIAAEIRLKSNDISFLSEVDLSPESLDYVRGHVDDILRSKTGTDDECVLKAFVLVDIGCRFYQENNYWPRVVDERNRTSRYGKIDRLDQREKDDYNRSFSRGLEVLGLKKGRDTPRQIERILIHSFVPEYRMDDFFDFVLQVYIKILGYSTEELDEGFDTLSRFMKDLVDGKNTDVVDYVPNPQKLLMCTRYALCDVELFGPFMKKLIEIIDSGIKGVQSTVAFSSRFVKAFDLWFDNYMTAKGRKRIRSEYQRRPRLRLTESGNLGLFISQRKCNKGDSLIVVWNGSEYIGPQPNQFLLSGTTYAMDFSLNLSQICKRISVFDKFTVRLGDRVIYERKGGGNYVLFDEDGYESKELSEGYNTIAFRENVEVSPTDVIAFRGNGIMKVCVRYGDVLKIGNDTILVDDPDHPKKNIWIDKIDGIDAIIDEKPYPVTTENRVLFNIPVPDGSKIVLCVYGLNNRINRIVVGPDLKNYYRNKDECRFEFQIPNDNEDLLTIDVRENDERSICKLTFLYLPNFRPTFDREYYLDEPQGTLSLGCYGALNFETDQEKVAVPLRVQDTDVVLDIPVPSIWISFDRETWIGPRTHSYNVKNFTWDEVFIKTGTPMNVRLYTNSPKLGLDFKDFKDYRAFNLMEFKSLIEDSVNDPQSEYEIAISVDSNIRRKLFGVRVHNYYNFDEQRGEIEFRDLAGIPAKYVLKNKHKMFAEAALVPGTNKVNLDDVKGMTLFIMEQNPYSGKYDVKMLSKILGGSEYIIRDESGFRFVYKNDEIHFSSDPDDVDEVMREYESKMRFNAWMKKPEAKTALRKCIASQKSK